MSFSNETRCFRAAAIGVAFCLFLDPPLSPALGEGQEQAQRDPSDAPNLALGVGLGYANHFGKWVEVDGVTGATQHVVERDFSEHGAAIEAFADFGIFDLRSGDVGLFGSYSLAFPTVFMSFTIEPRYRLEIRRERGALRTVAPWLGAGVAFAFRGNVDQDYYLGIPLSLGCDLGLGPHGFNIGLAIHVSAINPVPVTRRLVVDGEERKYDVRMDNVAAFLRLSYQLF